MYKRVCIFVVGAGLGAGLGLSLVGCEVGGNTYIPTRSGGVLIPGGLTRSYVKTWNITSQPSGATVYLNGQPVGTTPCAIQGNVVATLSSFATTHHVLVTLEGYQPAGCALDQASNGRTNYDFTLTPP